MKKALNYPIILITLFLALGIITCYYLKPGQPLIYLLFTFSAVSLITAYIHSTKTLLQKPYFAVAALLMAFTVGMLSYSLHYAPNNKQHYSHLLTVEAPIIKGIVSERIKPNSYYEKYYFEITSVNKVSATGKVLLSVPKDSAATILHAGDMLITTAAPESINRPLNPYQFDYAEYMEGQNIFHQLVLKGNYIKAGQAKNFSYYSESIRNSLINSFKIHNYSANTLEVIKALLLGQRQDMDKELNDSYINAGVIHILAISGLHIGILYMLLNFLLKPLKRMGSKGRIINLVIILSFLWMFAVISGLSASVVRSVVMFSFISIGLFFNRSTSIINTLAVSMLVLLLARPGFLFDVGFQLSYAAVFSIVLLEPLYRKIRISKYKAVNYFTDVVAISVVAQIGVLPLSLYYFNQFPMLFPVANLIIIPLSTVALVTGLVVLFLNFVAPPLTIYAGMLLDFVITGMNNFIRVIASLENFVIKDISFTMWLNLLLYTILITMTLWLYKKTYIRTVSLLTAVLLFQAACFATQWNAAQHEELVVFHNRKSTMVAVSRNNAIEVHSNDALIAENKTVISYKKGMFNQTANYKPMQNVLWFNGKKILIIDSLAVYDTIMKPDALLLTQSPKVNLERLIKQVRPAIIIADATNYKSYVTRWQATCKKEKIPFHATAEKGYYRIE